MYYLWERTEPFRDEVSMLKKGDRTGFAHITCATSDELKECIIEIARQEKEYYEDFEN